MALSQFDIIKSLGESVAWFEKEMSWGVPIAELRHLTGRIGELYVAMMTLGQMAESVNQKGYDVVSGSGERISVKTVTTANHVSFNVNTFELVDRAIILRINPTDLCIEILYDLKIQELIEQVRECGGKYILGISKKLNMDASKADIGLSDPVKIEKDTTESIVAERNLLVVNRVEYKHYKIKQFENGSVVVYENGEKVKSSKFILRDIALEMNVSLTNSAGNPKNTQQLGDHVIKAIQNYQT